MAAVQLTGNEEFQKKVVEEKQPVMVDFYADWCGPCRMAEPVLNKLSDEFSGKAMVVKVDVDNPDNQDLVRNHQVMSIPTVVMYAGGKEVARDIGFIGEDGYRGMIDGALKG